MLEPNALRAAESLLAWWREAGVEPLEPLAAPPVVAASVAPGAAAPPPAVMLERRSFTDRVASRTSPPHADRPATGPRPADAPPANPARKPPLAAKRAAPPPSTPSATGADEALVEARALADRARTLAELKAALERFERHPLHASARSTVFARGAPSAPVMIVGEAPGKEEDEAGLPFVGRSGQLLDAMFAAIGLTDAEGLYVSNVLNWRPPGNRNPSDAEIALCAPFIRRHVALKRPAVLVVAGKIAAETLLATNLGITRLRGRWMTYEADGLSVPVLPIYHPAFILRRPIAKRETWADLLSLEARLADLET